MLLLPIASLLFLQFSGSDPVLESRIHQWIHTILVGDDQKQEDKAEAEVKAMFRKRGLPAVTEVGEEATYEFVLMACSAGPADFQKRVLRKVRQAARRHAVPADAAAYCEAHVRQERVKARAQKHAPAEPALGEQIEQLFKTDQAAREKSDFDRERMSQIDHEHAAALEAIFERYGVPTYRMVGPEAASNFVTMIQHQSPEFRTRVLPKLKANVEAGEASPESYATVFDRAQSDAGKKQLYGENLTCDTQHPKLHTGPIEDETHVNERRAAIGLMRLELYAQLVVAVSPDVCPAASEAK